MMEPTKEAIAIRRRLKAGRFMLTDLSRKLGISKAAVYERLSSNRKWRKPTLRAYRQALRALENGDNTPIDDSIELSEAPDKPTCVDNELVSPMERVDELRGMTGRLGDGEGNSRPSDVELLRRITKLEQRFDTADLDRIKAKLHKIGDRIISIVDRIDSIERRTAAPKRSIWDQWIGRQR